MKNLFVSVFLAVALQACMQPYQLTTFPNQGKLTPFPVPPPHEREVKIYFPGEAVRDTDYVKIMVLETSAYSGTSYDDLVKLMKAKARLHGLDAVILLEKEDKVTAAYHSGSSSKVGNNTTYRPSYYTYSSYPVLSGLGIVYRKNLNYVTRYLKSMTLTEAGTGNQQQVRLDLDGNPLRPYVFSAEKQDFFADYTRKFEPFYLLKQNKNWFLFNDETGRLRKREYQYYSSPTQVFNYSAGYVGRSCKFTYNKDTIQEIRLADGLAAEFIKVYHITLTYDAQKRISQTLIRLERKPFLKQKFYYDEENRLIRSELFKTDGSEEMLFLKTEYQYCTLEDFME